jgi:hypothetical protein
MKCQQGDLAKIIYSIRPENIGKIVLVKEYIGKYSKGDSFDFKGIKCLCAVNDHYWWITAEYGLENQYGDTSQAYIPDTWLEPLRPDSDKIKQKELAPQEIDVAA